MKRLIVFAALALACIDAAAQSDSTSKKHDKLSEIEALSLPSHKKKSAVPESLFDYDMLSYSGYGLLRVKKENFSTKMLGHYEVFSNILEGRVNPCDWMSVNLGLDIAWKGFRSDSCVFALDSNKDLQILNPEQAGGPFDSYNSYLKCFNLAFPLTVRFHGSHFSARLGAQAEWNIYSWTVTRTKKDNYRGKDTYKRTNLNALSYSLIAGINYYGVGVYFKYSPSSCPIFSSENAKFGYTSFGIVLGL